MSQDSPGVLLLGLSALGAPMAQRSPAPTGATTRAVVAAQALLATLDDGRRDASDGSNYRAHAVGNAPAGEHAAPRGHVVGVHGIGAIPVNCEVVIGAAEAAKFGAKGQDGEIGLQNKTAGDGRNEWAAPGIAGITESNPRTFYGRHAP